MTPVHPSQIWFACRSSFSLKDMVRPSTVSGSVSGNRHVPRAPLPATGATLSGEMSSISFEGVTLRSSLIRAHAPDQIPPSDFGCPISAGLCRLLSAPAGRWPFPTLSPQSVSRRLDPYPAAFLATMSVSTRSQNTGLARKSLPAVRRLSTEAGIPRPSRKEPTMSLSWFFRLSRPDRAERLSEASGGTT